MTCTAAFPLTLIQTLIAITFNLKCDKKILYIPIRRLTFLWWCLNCECREKRRNSSRSPKNPKLHKKKKIQSTWRFLNFPPGFSAVKKIFSIQFIIVLQCRTSQFQTLSLNLQPPSKLVPPLGSQSGIKHVSRMCYLSLSLAQPCVCFLFS